MKPRNPIARAAHFAPSGWSMDLVVTPEAPRVAPLAHDTEEEEDPVDHPSQTAADDAEKAVA